MSKQVNVNFHQTFKPECQYISSILDIADGITWRSVKDISAVTGIPQGTSSGKVEPHISYILDDTMQVTSIIYLLIWKRFLLT